MNESTVISGQTYELGLPWGPTIRGVRWGRGDAVALFLHEPGEDCDLDAWGDLPVRLATALDASAFAIDVPGHGLSDDPWDPNRLSDVISALVGNGNPAHPTLIVAAGESATASLSAAAHCKVSAVAALSADPFAPSVETPRSPSTAKLFFAGAQSREDLAVSRKLASSLGGWTVVTSIPTDTRGTAMLATEWGARVSEHLVGFARDVLFRRQAASAMRPPVRPNR